MSSGVNQHVGPIVKIIVMLVGIKDKLHNLHSRKAKMIPQLIDLFSHLSKILNHNIHLRISGLQLTKEFISGRFHPFARLCRLTFRGNLPVGIECAEMINS